MADRRERLAAPIPTSERDDRCAESDPQRAEPPNQAIKRDAQAHERTLL